LACVILLGLTGVAHTASAQPPVPFPQPDDLEIPVDSGDLLPAPGRSIAISTQFDKKDGRRTVQIEANGEEIRFSDRDDADIQLTWTRNVAGRKKTETFKAADLPTLRKNHAEAARLYEKYRPYAPKEAPRAFAPIDRFPAPFVSTMPRLEPRTIVVERPGQILEIKDRLGSSITVRVTPLSSNAQNASSPPQEVKFANFAELQQKQPDWARLYVQYTGTGEE